MGSQIQNRSLSLDQSRTLNQTPIPSQAQPLDQDPFQDQNQKPTQRCRVTEPRLL